MKTDELACLDCGESITESEGEWYHEDWETQSECGQPTLPEEIEKRRKWNRKFDRLVLILVNRLKSNIMMNAGLEPLEVVGDTLGREGWVRVRVVMRPTVQEVLVLVAELASESEERISGVTVKRLADAKAKIELRKEIRENSAFSVLTKWKAMERA